MNNINTTRRREKVRKKQLRQQFLEDGHAATAIWTTIVAEVNSNYSDVDRVAVRRRFNLILKTFKSTDLKNRVT